MSDGKAVRQELKVFTQNSTQKFILASASPRRAYLLSALGLKFEITPAHINENAQAGETAQNLVERLSLEKARTIARNDPQAWVLAADTVVVLADEILGKPNDRDDAARMLNLIQGHTHKVWGGIALLHSKEHVQEVHSYVSEVEIVKLSLKQIQAYIDSGEPLDKAGAYAIQGIGAALVSRVVGSYTNVVGLNLSAVLELFAKHKLIS